MRIIIQLDRRDPPTGTIRLGEESPEDVIDDEASPLGFEGWLNLVGILYEVLGYDRMTEREPGLH